MKLQGRLEKQFTDSGISRIWRLLSEHDCGFITACGNTGRYTELEKRQRAKSLRSKIEFKGYGITKIKGVDFDRGFLVVDTKDWGTLKNLLIKLGKDFEEEKVIFSPKMEDGKFDGYLIGLDGKETKFVSAKFGKNLHLVSTDDEPFLFEGHNEDIYIIPKGVNNKWGVYLASKRHWSEIQLTKYDK